MTMWEWIGIGALALVGLLVIGFIRDLLGEKFPDKFPTKMDYNEHAEWGYRYGQRVMEIQNEITFLLPEDKNDRPILDPQFQSKAIAKLNGLYRMWRQVKPPTERQRVHDLLLNLINSTMRELQSGLTDKEAQQESEYLMSALQGELDRLAKRYGS